MLNVIRGASPSTEITLSNDQIAWIASNPEEYKQNNACLVSLLALIKAEKEKLSKAKNLDNLIKKAKENEVNTEKVLSDAKTEAAKLKKEASEAATATLKQAKDSTAKAKKDIKSLQKKVDESMMQAHEDCEKAKSYSDAAKVLQAAIDKEKQGLRDKQQALQVKVDILSEALQAIAD